MAVTTWAPHSPDERSNCIWVHLRQVGDSNAVCVGSSTGHWAVGADGWGRVGSTVSSGATKIATAAVQVQPSLLNMVWQPYTEKENDGERVVLVLVWSPAGVKWTVLHSPWTWKLTGVGPVCQLSSVCLQTPKHLHSSRDIFVTQKKQIETSSTKTQLKALKH